MGLSDFSRVLLVWGFGPLWPLIARDQIPNCPAEAICTYLRDFLRFLNDLRQRLPSDVLADLPGGESVALLEDVLNFFQRSADSLREHEEHMEEGREVECAEDKVGLPGDRAEPRGNCEGKGGVECPV